MKKNGFFLFLLIFLLVFPLISFAKGYIDTSDKTDLTSEEITKLIADHCYCGREYYTEETDGHAVYDCVKCGQNMYVCKCNCWCGAETEYDTNGTYGSFSVKVCSECKLPCILCVCRSDREAIIYAEQQRRDKEISSLNIIRPQNVLTPILAVLFSAIFIALSIWANRSDVFNNILKKLPETQEHDETDDSNTKTVHSAEPKEARINEQPTKNGEAKREDEPIAIPENKSSGAFKLYKTILASTSQRSEHQPLLAHDEPDLTFTEEEISLILKVARLTPNERSALTVIESETMADTLAELILEGIIIKENETLVVERNILQYIADLAQPSVSVVFDTVFSGKYTFCTCGKNWYSLNGNNEVEIRVFEDPAALCEWICDVFDVPNTEKNIPSTDISFDYAEFSLYSIIRILGFSDPFAKEDILTSDICKKIRDSLYSSGFFKTAESFAVISRENGFEHTCDSMKKKGLLFESDGRFMCSRAVNAVLNCEDLRDCIHLTKHGNASFEMMLVLKQNGAAAIYDDGQSVRVVSAANIPWKQYII